MTFKIDPEFRRLLPAQKPEERERLKKKILNEGVNSGSIIVGLLEGERYLIDGHNTHDLCIAEEIDLPPSKEIIFASREEVKRWIIDNQLARRNLTDEQRTYFIGKEYQNEKQAHGGQLPGGSAQNDHSLTAEKIGEKHNIAPATVRRAEEFAEGVDKLKPKAQEAVLTGQSGQPKSQIATGIFCRDCRITKPKKDCPKCKQLRASKNGKPQEKKQEDEPTDAEGHSIAPACAKAFANVAIFEELDSLARQMQTKLDELSRLPGGEQLERCLTPTGNDSKKINKSEHLQALKRDLKGTRPHSVCPWCCGKGKCTSCRSLGWVTKTAWDNADAKTKAKLK